MVKVLSILNHSSAYFSLLQKSISRVLLPFFLLHNSLFPLIYCFIVILVRLFDGTELNMLVSLAFPEAARKFIQISLLPNFLLFEYKLNPFT